MVEDIRAAKETHPGALVLMHPECQPAVRAEADYVGSTMGIIRYAQQSPADSFIIATEQGVLYELTERCPQKHFYMASRQMLCVNMKKTTLEKVRTALTTLEPRVIVPVEIRDKAREALQKMLEITGR